MGRNVLGHTLPQPAVPKKMGITHENRSDSDDHWKSLPGSGELFQPSQSMSIEYEARENCMEARKHHLGPEANEFLY